MNEEITRALTEANAAHADNDMERLRDAAAELWRLTRHPAADYARDDYAMHSGD
jgi:hypothetical protein